MSRTEGYCKFHHYFEKKTQSSSRIDCLVLLVKERARFCPPEMTDLADTGDGGELFFEEVGRRQIVRRFGRAQGIGAAADAAGGRLTFGRGRRRGRRRARLRRPDAALGRRQRTVVALRAPTAAAVARSFVADAADAGRAAQPRPLDLTAVAARTTGLHPFLGHLERGTKRVVRYKTWFSNPESGLVNNIRYQSCIRAKIALPFLKISARIYENAIKTMELAFDKTKDKRSD